MHVKITVAFSVATLLLIGFITMSAMMMKVDDKLDQAEAIKLAEDFVRKNGYTSSPADKSQLKYELFDRYEKDIDVVLKQRHNTLHPKAFCISEDTDQWDIGFLSAKVNVATLSSVQRQVDLPGRAVIVRKDGKEAMMAHKDPLFSYFKKLP